MSRYLGPKAGERDLYESYWDQISREKTLIIDKYAEGKDIRSIAIAVNMLKNNEPQDKICQFTGLSQEDLLTLQNELSFFNHSLQIRLS